MKKFSCQSPEQPVSEKPSHMKSQMMGKPLPPKPGAFYRPALFGGADMQRISQNQRTAHPQTMQAANEPDDKRSNEVEKQNHKIKIKKYE